MNDFFKKFERIESEISSSKGEFVLFAVFLREDAPDKWDMVVSAPWLHKESRQLLEDIVMVVKKYLSSDIIRLSRVVVLDNNDPALKAIQKAVNVDQGGVEIHNSNFFGLQIKHAYIISSKRITL